MKLTHIVLKNFKGVESLSTAVYDRTLISGKNATGKTSVRDGIFWVLTDKMSDGNPSASVKPHDADGNPIHNLETSVSLIFEATATTSVMLTKTLTEKWVKHRGESEATFDGDTVSYKVNGVDKTPKEFKQIVAKIFPEDALVYGTNASAFLNLDGKKRRSVLLNAFSAPDEYFIGSDPKWADIATEMAFSTPEDAILSHKRQIKTIEAKIAQEEAAIELLEDRLDEDLPSIEDIENQIEGMHQTLADCRYREDVVRKEINRLISAKGEFANRKLELAELHQKANEDLVKTRRELNTQLIELQTKKADLRVKQLNATRDMNACEDELRNASAKKIDVQTRKFDDGQTVCPVCGQKLPKVRIDEIHQKFDDEIQTALKKLDNVIGSRMADLPKLRTACDDIEMELSKVDYQIDVTAKQLSEIPDTQEPTTDEYIEKKRQIGILEHEISDKESKHLEDVLQVEQEQTKAILDGLNSLEGMLERVRGKDDLKISIEHHQQDIDEFREEIGDQMALIDQIEEYHHEQIRRTTDAINSHFGIIKWEMFKTHKDGSTELCCEPIVGGTSYYRGLNHGDKLLAEIDVCQAFQKASGAEMFITLDDAESVDPDRIPILNNQVIVFRRTDEQSLTITEL